MRVLLVLCVFSFILFHQASRAQENSAADTGIAEVYFNDVDDGTPTNIPVQNDASYTGQRNGGANSSVRDSSATAADSEFTGGNGSSLSKYPSAVSAPATASAPAAPPPPAPDQSSSNGNYVDNGNVVDVRQGFNLYTVDGKPAGTAYPMDNPVRILRIIRNPDGNVIYQVQNASGTVGYTTKDKFESAMAGEQDSSVPKPPLRHLKKDVIVGAAAPLGPTTKEAALSSFSGSNAGAPPLPSAATRQNLSSAPPLNSPETDSTQLISDGNNAIHGLHRHSKFGSEQCEFGDFIKTGNMKEYDIDRGQGNISKNCGTYNSQICKYYYQQTGGYPDVNTFALIKATIQQESGYDPQAYRCERDFGKNYKNWDADLPKCESRSTNHLSRWYDTHCSLALEWAKFKGDAKASAGLKNEEQQVRAYECSPGPMQVFYPTAYDELGFKGKPADLFNLDQNIYYGIKEFLQKEATVDHALKFSSVRNQLANYNENQLMAFSYNRGSVGSWNIKNFKYDVLSPEARERKRLEDEQHGIKPPHKGPSDGYSYNVNNYAREFKQMCPQIQSGNFCPQGPPP
jgi:hypothetical protein